jgi:hypothetical protein
MTEQVISERAWVMAKEKTKGEELSAIGKQTSTRTRRWIITSII